MASLNLVSLFDSLRTAKKIADGLAVIFVAGFIALGIEIFMTFNHGDGHPSRAPEPAAEGQGGDPAPAEAVAYRGRRIPRAADTCSPSSSSASPSSSWPPRDTVL
eukprot:TRINITY_DN8158_c0_g2_i1.p2 TRINITY_DN8158_c0_g2~~TRINITY_DN8158_c0_g2_i1.p2  ORF type:complete len:105 (+),score=7.68 TRINITY_DN8158_c0_g2_i1:253-567(+)